MTILGTNPTDATRATILGEIGELLQAKDACDFYLAQRAHALRELGLSSHEICEQVSEWVSEHDVTRNPLTSPSQVTKYAVWGAMPDEPHVRALGVSRAYALRGEEGWEDDAKRAADPTDPYTWSAFDADALGKLPAVEKEWCTCACGHRHPKKEE